MISSDFLALNEDIIFSGLDMDKLISAHKKSNAMATLVLANSKTPPELVRWKLTIRKEW